MKTTLHFCVMAFAVMASLHASLTTLSAATISWTNTAGGNWSAAANWSGGALPAAADTVLITAPGTYAVTQDVNVTVTSLTLGGASGRQTLTNAGYTLTLNGASGVAANGVLGFGNGTLTGAGLLTLNGLCLWGAGNWSGPVLVAAGGALDLVGNTDKGLFGSVTNQGTITWSGTNQLLMGGGRIHNQSGGLFEIRNNQNVASLGGAPTIQNSGTIRKSAVGGVTVIGVPLINSGTLDVQSGMIAYASASVFNSGTAFTGSGTNYLNNGIVTFNGSFSSQNLEIASDVNIAGTHTLSGTARWIGGTISGAMTIAADGTLNITGTADRALSGSLNNQGWIVWSGANTILMAGGHLTNFTSGVFEIRNNQVLAFYSGAPNVNNSGTIRKSSGGGDSTIAVPLINSGTLDVLSGRVGYWGGSQFNSGTSFTGTGTNTVYTGTVTFSGALTSENLEITSDSTLTVAGIHTLSGTARWIGGTISGAMTVAANGTLNITGTADRALSGSLNNQGWLVWSGANTILMAGGHLTNFTSGVFEIQNNQVLAFYSGAPNVNNSGTIRKGGGGGDSTIAVPLINSGTLDVQSGRLGFVGGSQFNTGTAFTGAGTNVVYTGTVTFNGALSSENLEITSDGTLSVGGTHAVSGTVKWTGGTISGAMTIAANGTLNITGTADHALTGSLNNLGLVTWAGANTIYVHNAPITNAAGALFEIQNNQTLSLYNGSPKFNNRGTIRKTTGGGITIIGLPLINSGTLDAQSGMMAYASGSQFNSGTTFTGVGTNLVYTGTVTFNGAIPSENLEIGGAAFGGNSSFSGLVHWTSGALADDSAFTIAANGELRITGSAIKNVTGSLTNLGLVTWSGPNDIEMHLTARIVNSAGALFDIQNNQSLYIYNGVPRFINSGTIRKSAGGGTSVISVPLNNSGALDVRSGLVAYGAGSQFNFGTAFTGMGTNLVYTGNVTFTGTILSENLEIGGASVLGTNTLVGTVKWTSGEIGEPAHVTIATNGTLNIIGTPDRSIRDILSNAGHVNWSGPSTILFVHTGTISNLTGGTFEMQNDGALAHYSGVSTFKNAGVLRKSAGTGATTINLSTFNNTGTVDAQTGMIRFLNSYTQTGGRLQFGLSSVTNFGQMQFAQPAPLTGTLAANLLRGFRPTTGDAFAVISYFPSYTGGFTSFDLPSEAAWQTNSSIYGANVVTLTVINVRPAIEPIPDKTTDEQVLLSFLIVGNDPDSGSSLSYALVNPPENASINASSGLFSWTPTEAQGPSTNPVTVRVTDNGTPALSRTNDFTIIVREVNRRPAPVTLGSFFPNELTLFSLTTPLATDPDLPANALRFELLDAPAGMAINTNTGTITWTPTEAQGPSLNTIVVRITDNGSPPLGATNSFIVHVAELNVAPTLGSISNRLLVLGDTLRFTNTATDSDIPANQLTFQLVNAPDRMDIMPATGVLSWTPQAGQSPGTNAIVVRVTDNGVPARSDETTFTTVVIPVPSLTIRETGMNQIVLSWPALASQAGFVLRSSTNLNSVAAWIPVTNSPVTIGTDHLVTNTTHELFQFHRLHRQ